MPLFYVPPAYDTHMFHISKVAQIFSLLSTLSKKNYKELEKVNYAFFSN